MTHATQALQRHDLSGQGINSESHTYFLTTQGHGEPPRMSEQLNVGATSETAQTWKTIHTRHTLIHSNKVTMKWWLWRPNDIRGPCLSKVSWHLSYRWGKIPEKLHPGNLSRPGIEPGPAAWQPRMLPPVPQWWTNYNIILKNVVEVINIKDINMIFYFENLDILERFPQENSISSRSNSLIFDNNQWFVFE